MAKQTWRWVRNVSAKHEDAWREKLSFLDPESLVVHGRPGKTLIRIEAYAQKTSILRALKKVFGGRVEKFDADRIAARANAPRRPLRIGRVLGVIDTHGEWPKKIPHPKILLQIASAMAFGTGEHATTAACLRFLIDEAESCEPGWACLDLGTGSGILAIAAEKLGAGRVRAIECDSRAVKAARTNVRRNHCSKILVTAGNLLSGRADRTRYRVVLANVFSEVLRAAAPRIVQSVAPRGCMILSGILRPQEHEVLRTFRALGMRRKDALRRGKWVTLRLRAR